MADGELGREGSCRLSTILLIRRAVSINLHTEGDARLTSLARPKRKGRRLHLLYRRYEDWIGLGIEHDGERDR
ncbi:MAG: hypothetical protein ACE5Z5_01905 [Candidatus Bathyarchaeia archaeon]